MFEKMAAKQPRTVLFAIVLVVVLGCLGLGLTTALAGPPHYTLSYFTDGGGQVVGNIIQSVPAGGDGETVWATPDPGCAFSHWSDGSTDPERTDTNVTHDISVTAYFDLIGGGDPGDGGGDPGDGGGPASYTLSYSAGEGGTISGTSPQYVLEGSNGDPVTAVADPGYHFVGWSDFSLDNPRTDTNVFSDVSLTAFFAPDASDPLSIRGLTSHTHPVPTDWYSNNRPTFSWVTTGTSTFSWALDRTPSLDTLDPALMRTSSGFSGPSLAATNTDLLYVTAADLNGDGIPDLVGTDAGQPSAVVVLLGLGGGAFGPAQTYYTPTTYYGANRLVVADFNGDGAPDLAVTEHDPYGYVTVMLNDGSGAFPLSGCTTLHTGSPYAMGIAAGDVNGDGVSDLVVANDYNKVISVFLGNGSAGVGDGTFADPVTYQAGSGAYGVALADMNRDGSMDIVSTGEGDNSLTVMLNAGNGTFPASSETSYTTDAYPTELAIGDFNHDGNPDVAVACSGGGTGPVRVFDGSSSGALVERPAPVSQGGAPVGLAAPDLDHDGYSDLVVADRWAGNVKVILNDGTGSFRDPVVHALHLNSTVESLVMADTDADGQSEILCAGYGPGAQILTPDAPAQLGPVADGVWYFHVRATSATGTVGPVSTREVRVDVTKPVVTLSGASDGAAYIAGAAPRATLTAEDAMSGVTDLRWRLMTDPAWNVAEGSAASFDLPTSSGGYTYEYRATDAAGNVLIGRFRVFIFGDITGLASSTHPVESTWYKNPSPALSWDTVVGAAGYSYAVDHNPEDPSLNLSADPVLTDFRPVRQGDAGVAYPGVAVADFNGDGYLDVVGTVNSPSGIHIRFGRADGTFSTPQAYPVMPFTGGGGGAYDVAVGDFNGDGRPDIAVTVTDWEGKVGVLLNDGEGHFGAPTWLYTGQYYSEKLAVGDVTGDGNADIVTTNNHYVSSNISVFAGHGDGTFAAPRAYNTQSYPWDIALGDMNGDGHLDVVTVEDTYPAGSVSLLINNGDGTFPSPSDRSLVHSYDLGMYPMGLALADLNGDGRLDVATSDGQDHSLDVFDGNGDGTLKPMRSFVIGDVYGTRGIASGDFNGDGIPDLAIVRGWRTYPLINDGSGTFPSSLENVTGYEMGSGESVVAADLNQDGVSDLVVSDGNPQGFGALLSNPPHVRLGSLDDGLWYFHVRAVSGETGGPVATRAVRIDAHAPTFTLSGSAKGGAYLPGTAPAAIVTAVDGGSGVATFRWKRSTDEGWTTPESDSARIEIPNAVGRYAYQYEATDVAGNASRGSFAVTVFEDITGLSSSTHPDEATWYSNSQPNVSWDPIAAVAGYAHSLDHDPTGSELGTEPSPVANGFAVPVASDTSWNAGFQDIVTADFEHNGSKDVAGVGYNGAYFVQVFHVNADGTMTSLDKVGTPEGSYYGQYTPQAVVTEDVNGDGWPDLVVTLDGGPQGGIGVLLNDHEGGFGPWTMYATGTSYVFGLAAGDVNGDGNADMVCTNSNNGVCVFLGNGDGTFQTAATYPSGNWTTRVALADFNGDGKLDIVGMNGDGTVSALLNNGDGTFPASWGDVHAYSAGAGVSLTCIAVGDVNGDGTPDVVLGDANQLGVIVLHGTGDGTLSAPQRVGDNFEASDIAVADVNGDGTPDVVALTRKWDFWGQYYESNSVAVLLNDGAGSFPTSADLYSCVDWGGVQTSSLALTDVNGDGIVDAVVGNEWTSQMKVMFGKAPNVTMSGVEDGLWYFHVRGVASDGAAGPVATRAIRIDTQAPSVDTGDLHSGDSYSTLGGNPQMTLTAVDPGMPDASGVAEIHYMISNDEVWHTVGSDVATVDLPTTPGGYWIYYYAVDGAGNEGSTQSIWVQAVGDTTPPYVDMTGAVDGGVYLSGQAPQVTLTVVDPGMPDASGPRSFFYYDPTFGYLYPEGTTTTFDLPTQPGTYTYWVYAYDGANNQGYFQFTVTIVGEVTGLHSPTHPTSERWYSNNMPAFVWDVAGGAGYSYSFDQTPDGTPDAVADPVASAKLLRDYTSYEMGSSPESVASGDFDKDGHPDLVTANRDSNTVSVRLNDGAGGFDTGDGAVSYDVGSSPSGVTVADFNGDGNLDIATANCGDYTVSILLGNGDGTFGEQTTYDSGFPYPYAITTGDFNGDGRPDIALASWDDTTGFSTLINNGEGFDEGDGFAEAQYWDMGAVYTEGGIATADVNGDGRDDIVMSVWNADDGNGGVVLAYNDGTGAFPSENQDFIYTDTYPTAVAVGDFNGDHRPDIAAADTDGTDLIVMYNDGEGSFSPDNASWLEQYSSDTYGLAAADVNGDGVLDLVSAENDDELVSVWLGGEGFGQRQDFDAMSNGRGVVAADFNGDGKADVATGNYDDGVSVLLAGSPANVVEGPVDDGTYYFHVRPIAGDAAGNTSTMQVNIDTHAPEVGTSRLFNGGTYSGEQSLHIGADDAFSGVASIDWRFAGQEWTNVEGDGVDVTIPADPGTYEVGYRATDHAGNVSDVQTFTATIQPLTTPVIDITGLESPTHPDSAKWYSNPWPQFSWDTTTRAQFAYSIDQDPSGDPGTDVKSVDPAGLFSQITPYQMGIFGLGVGIGDFNKDGHLDLAVTDINNDTVRVLLNDGHGAYKPEDAVVCGVEGEPASVVVADMNGDGNEDLVVGLIQSTSVAVIYGHGDGSFGAPEYVGAMPDAASVAVGDFNGDGKLDIAAGHFLLDSESSFFVVLHQTDEGWDNTAVDTPARLSGGITAGDLNGDGLTDLAFGKVGDGGGLNGILIALSNEGGGFTFQQLDAPVATVGIAIEDMNGDGAPDILASDVGGLSQLGIFYNNGSGFFSIDDVAWLPQLAPLDTTVNVADVNGDGIKDVISTFFFEGGPDAPLSVWLGQPGGTYGVRQDYPIGTTGLGVATGDLNDDGVADIAVSSILDESGGVIVLNGGALKVTTTMGPLEDGTYYFHVRSVGADEEAGSVGTMQVNIDTQAPSVEATGVVDEATYTTPQHVTITATDTLSGVATIEWMLGESEPTVVTSDTASIDIPTEPGTYSYSYRATDNAGNATDWQTFTLTMAASVEPPAVTGLVSPTHPDDSVWYSNASPQFSWDATDTSGYVVSLDQSSTAEPDPSGEPLAGDATSITMGPVEDGVWYFHVRAVNGEGAGGPTSTMQVNVDTTGPISVLTPLGDGWQTGDAPLKLDVTDPGYPETGSGVQSVQVRLAVDGVEVVPWTTGEVDLVDGAVHLEGSLPPLDGDVTLQIRSFDAAGNVGNTAELTYKADHAAPSVDMSGVTDGETYTTPQHAVLHASDALSGVASIDWTLNDGDLTTVASDTTTLDIPTSPGRYTYSYRATDNAGNVGDWQSFTVTMQAPPAPRTHTLTYLAGEGGSVAGSATQVLADGAECTTVTAVPADHHHFVAWSDGVLTAARCDGTAEGDLTVTAIFAVDTRTLTYSADANGSIVGSTTQVVDYGANGTTVTATPAPAYRFVSWSDGVLTAARRDVGVTASLTVTATFELTPVAHDDTATAYGRRVFVTPLSNDDRGVGSIASFTQGEHGVVARVSDAQPVGSTVQNVSGYNTLSYTPVADFVGTDHFTYTTGGGMTATVTITVLPNVSAPTNVDGDKVSSTSVDVSWDAPASFGSGFAQYAVLWRTAGEGDWNVEAPVLDQGVTHQTIDGLTAGVTYEFKVMVTDTGEYSATSSPYSFLLVGDAIEPVAPPVTTHGDATATVTIGGVDPDATITVLPGASGVASFTVQGLSVHVTPEPGFSGVIDITLLVTDNGASSTIHAFVTVNPSDPYAVTFGPVSASKTRVQWAGSPNATGYRVYVGGIVVGTVGPGTSSFDLAGLLGPNAVVAVQAVGAGGTQSNVVRGTYLPGASVRIGAITFAGNSAKLTAKAKATLQRLARLVASQGFTAITINGYTARFSKGSAAFRKRLSAARCAAVKAYLNRLFTALHVKVRISVIAWGGKGATTDPKFRRAEIVLQ